MSWKGNLDCVANGMAAMNGRGGRLAIATPFVSDRIPLDSGLPPYS